MHNKDKIHTDDKDAGLALILILLIIAIATKNNTLFIPITVLLIIAMTAPIIFRPFAIIWFGLSGFLGRCSSAIILTILFIVIVIPIGYLRQITGSDPLQLKRWKKDEASAFLTREHRYMSSDMEKPF